jgi:GT2 family glycosyltransferase
MLNEVGIVIPTRDRWEDLYRTLQKLEEFGLGDNETIVMDDASREVAPPRLRARFPRVRFERSEHSRFVTGQRNDLASLLSTPYFLQLDDDSFPIVGNLSHAVAWLASHQDALGLAFIVTDGRDYSTKINAIPSQPFRCRQFIGCAGLIKRELFLDLGGYEETFEYSCEEIGLTLHAQLKGLAIYQYPGVVIQHNPSARSRNQSHRSVLLIRNQILVAGLHYPMLFLLIRSPLFVLKAIILKWVPRGKVTRGIIDALLLYPKILRKRKPVPIKPFLAWNRLPIPIEFKARFEALAHTED